MDARDLWISRKSTWIKAIKAGNFTGWPVIGERTVSKYYPKTNETPKGHMSQTRKNERSTKVKKKIVLRNGGAEGAADCLKRTFEEPNNRQLKGRKVKDVYTKVFDVKNTVFSDQTGQFPTRKQRGNKYVMVIVETDSNTILVEPLKNCTDPELARGYRAMMLRPKRAVIEPQ